MKVSRVGLGYPAVSFALVVGGIIAVWVSAAEAKRSLMLGAVAAWLLQVPAYWVLVDRLERGLDATKPWLAGMAARIGGFALLAVLSWVSSLPLGPAAISYALALVAFLILEAIWLAVTRSLAGGRRAPRVGREVAGREVAGRETAGREVAGREVAGRETVGRETTRRGDRAGPLD